MQTRGKGIYIEADGQHSHSPGMTARKVSGTCRCTTWRRLRMAWLYDATFTAAQVTYNQNVHKHRQRKYRQTLGWKFEEFSAACAQQGA